MSRLDSHEEVNKRVVSVNTWLIKEEKGALDGKGSVAKRDGSRRGSFLAKKGKRESFLNNSPSSFSFSASSSNSSCAKREEENPNEKYEDNRVGKQDEHGRKTASDPPESPVSEGGEFLRRLREQTGFNIYENHQSGTAFGRRKNFSMNGKRSTFSENVGDNGKGSSGQKANDKRKLLFFHVLDPWERSYYISLTVCSAAALYNIFALIARATLDFLEELFILWVVLDYFADFVYIFDTVCQACKGYLREGVLVTDLKTVVKRYFLTWRSTVDVLAVFPFELLMIFCARDSSRTLFRFNRLLKFLRLNEFLDRTWKISSYPNACRLCILCLYFIICIHWNACVYYEFSKRIGFDSDRWVLNRQRFGNGTDWLGVYASCLYWSAMRLTNIGEVPAPETNAEIVFTCVDMIIAIAVFAGIFGSIEELLERKSERVHNYHRWTDQVQNYMKRHRIPDILRRRVKDWMVHYWNENRLLDGGNSCLAILPDRLQAEINMNAHLDTLRRVRFFQDCEPGLLVALLNKLTLVMFNPGEYICKKGDVGKEMYIVKSGRLSVVGPDGHSVYATLTEGAVFGELSLLNISGVKSGNRRTASIRSNGFSDLFCLSKEDLWAALQDYPEARRIFIEKGREVLIKDGLLDGYVRLDQFTLLSQVAQYECVQEKTDHLIVRMSAMVVGMGAMVRSTRERLRNIEKQLEKYRQARERQKIQIDRQLSDDVF